MGLEVPSTSEGKGMFQGYNQEDRLKATLRPAGPLPVLYTGSPEEKFVFFWRRASNQDTRESRRKKHQSPWKQGMSVSLSGSPLCLLPSQVSIEPVASLILYSWKWHSYLERLNVQKILNRVWRLESSTRWLTPSKIPSQRRPLVNNHHPHTNHFKSSFLMFHC